MSDTPSSATEHRAPDRGALLAAGVTTTATWSLRLLLVAAGVVLIGLVVGQIWVVLLPVVLALILATLLAPVASWLHRRRLPASLASAITVIGGLGLLVGLVALIAPPVFAQVDDIATQASGGLTAVQEWLTGPPLNLNQQQISAAVDGATAQLRGSASVIAGGVFTGVSAVTSALVTAVLVLLLTFYFIKDGHRFLSYVQRTLGRRAGGHVNEVLGRSWRVLGSFIRTQALVAVIDGVLIGLGLVVLGVPLALPLAVITFILSFIPILGAVVAGGLAVLVALVTNGFGTALLVLGVVLVVQQIEGNILLPILQSHSLKLHPALVLLAVTGGGSLFGIVGAFLAVPVVAVASEVLRYVSQQIDARAAPADVVPSPAGPGAVPGPGPGPGPAQGAARTPGTTNSEKLL